MAVLQLIRLTIDSRIDDDGKIFLMYLEIKFRKILSKNDLINYY